MLFIDTIHIDASTGRAEGRLFVDPSWEYLRDHFPGAPVLPGLVMLQAAVQTASALLVASAGARHDAELHTLDRLQIVRPIVPGETLTVEARLLSRGGDGASAAFHAEGRVGDAPAMHARFRLRPLTAWSTAC